MDWKRSLLPCVCPDVDAAAVWGGRRAWEMSPKGQSVENPGPLPSRGRRACGAGGRS